MLKLMDKKMIKKSIPNPDLYLLQELGRLLPEMSVDIIMYGNEICTQCDGRSFESNNVKISVQQSLYHRRADNTRKPHLVIGMFIG